MQTVPTIPAEALAQLREIAGYYGPNLFVGALRLLADEFRKRDKGAIYTSYLGGRVAATFARNEAEAHRKRLAAGIPPTLGMLKNTLAAGRGSPLDLGGVAPGKANPVNAADIGYHGSYRE